MRVVRISKYGPPDVMRISEAPIPEFGNSEILIEVYSSVVTTAGLISRLGTPLFARLFSGLTKPKKDIPGMEFSGVIVRTGAEVKKFKEGQKVFGLSGLKLSAHAQYLSINEEAVVLQNPENVNHDEVVASIEGGLTAINFLLNKARIQSNQQILINGASGSVGTAAIQIAKRYNAEITAVCTEKNHEIVKSLGAHHVIDYTKQDFTKTGKKYDVIFDTVGNSSFMKSRSVLNPKGVYLDPVKVTTVLFMLLTRLRRRKRAIMSATYMRSNAQLRGDLVLLRRFIDDGALRPVIERTYEMEDIVEAHKYVEGGHKVGNVVLRIAVE